MARRANENSNVVGGFYANTGIEVFHTTAHRQRTRLVFRAQSFSLGTRPAAANNCLARAGTDACDLSQIETRRKISAQRQSCGPMERHAGVARSRFSARPRRTGNAL